MISITQMTARCAGSIALGLWTGLALAEEPTPYLLGDWHGQRTALAERGFDFELVATADVLGNLEGGIEEGVEALGNLDLIMTIDTGAAGWWQNGNFNVYFLGNAGGDPSLLSGDLQVASSIEAPDTFKLYEAWYEHHFLDDRFSVLLGLHDVNSEFYVTEHGGLFLNSSFGIGVDVAQVGPSIFPTTSLGLRLRFAPTANSYLLAAVYDGVAGDPTDPYGTHVSFDDGDGVFTIAEAGLIGNEANYYKLGIGGWVHTARFDDFNGITRDDNGGIYLLGEGDIWRTEDGRGVGVFAQAGFADEDRNQIGTYLGAGVNWTGPLPGRPEDVAGVAVAHARNSDKFRDATPGADEAETTLEVTYLVTPTPWLSIQPDLQYIMDPGTDPSLDDSVVLGFRVQLSL